jgi:hypothetical protein
VFYLQTDDSAQYESVAGLALDAALFVSVDNPAFIFPGLNRRFAGR